MSEVARILVVDDDPGAVGFFKEALHSAGYDVATAGSGPEALDLVREHDFDLVLLDIFMPEMDGYEVLKRIKDEKKAGFIPVILVTGLGDINDKIKGLEAGADDFLNKPVMLAELLARTKSLVQLKHLNDHLENTENVLFTIARTVEAKDPSTEGHLKRMADYASGLARHIGLSHEMTVAMSYAGILHDIGKIGVSDRILLKPAPLTPEEFKEMRQHVLIGENIVKPLRFSAHIAPAVRSHHERWDGNGYPDGLKGENIPLEARIVAVADAYDSMTSDRPYRPSVPPEEAKELLREGMGTQWDPALVKAFLEMIAK